MSTKIEKYEHVVGYKHVVGDSSLLNQHTCFFFFYAYLKPFCVPPPKKKPDRSHATNNVTYVSQHLNAKSYWPCDKLWLVHCEVAYSASPFLGEWLYPQGSRTGMVRISFEALRPLLAVVRQQPVVLLRHCSEVDRPIQTIGHVGIWEHCLMELVHDPEEWRVSDNMYVILGKPRKRSVGSLTTPVMWANFTHRMVVRWGVVPRVRVSHDASSPRWASRVKEKSLRREWTH
jgi:hypothetical protein